LIFFEFLGVKYEPHGLFQKTAAVVPLRLREDAGVADVRRLSRVGVLRPAEALEHGG